MGQARARRGVGKGVGAIILICYTLYQHYTHWYLVTACSRTAPDIYQRDALQKMRHNKQS